MLRQKTNDCLSHKMHTNYNGNGYDKRMVTVTVFGNCYRYRGNHNFITITVTVSLSNTQHIYTHNT